MAKLELCLAGPCAAPQLEVQLLLTAVLVSPQRVWSRGVPAAENFRAVGKHLKVLCFSCLQQVMLMEIYLFFLQ